MNRLFTKIQYLKLRKKGKLPFTKEACAEALKSMREFKVKDGITIGYLNDSGEVVHERIG